MKYIKVPKPIQVINPVNGLPLAEPQVFVLEDGTLANKRGPGGEVLLKTCGAWSFWEFLCRYVTADPRLGKGDVAAKINKRLRKAFKKAEPNAVVTLDDADVEALKRVFAQAPIRGQQGQEIESQWPNDVMGQLSPFFEAIDRANEDKETVEKIEYDYDE